MRLYVVKGSTMVIEDILYITDITNNIMFC